MGEPRSGRGNFFRVLDLEIRGFLYITAYGGTSIGPGELFSGADFGNIGKSFITVGEPGPGRGNFFFGKSVI